MADDLEAAGDRIDSKMRVVMDEKQISVNLYGENGEPIRVYDEVRRLLKCANLDNISTQNVTAVVVKHDGTRIQMDPDDTTNNFEDHLAEKHSYVELKITD